MGELTGLTAEWCRNQAHGIEHSLFSGGLEGPRYIAALRIAARVLDEGAVDKCWEQLKRRCCSTRPESPGWDDVSAIVMFRKADLQAVITYLKGEGHDAG